MNGVLPVAPADAIGAILMGVAMATHPWRRPAVILGAAILVSLALWPTLLVAPAARPDRPGRRRARALRTPSP